MHSDSENEDARPAKRQKIQDESAETDINLGTLDQEADTIPPHIPNKEELKEQEEFIDSMPPEVINTIKNDSRRLTFDEFIKKYMNIDFTVRQLLLVFGFTLEAQWDSRPDIDLVPLLQYVIRRNNEKRQRRADVNSMDDVLRLLRDSSKVMVLTGAGVSVSAGIPDFRSENGIYSRLGEFGLDDPQQMFDIEFFRDEPRTFYSFAREIYPSNFKPTPSHMFIKVLEDQDKLLRNYTQNIDTLENETGIKRVIQCHGSFATAKCIACGYSVPGETIKEDIFEKRVPWCPMCDDGILKPDIVFFGEPLSQLFSDHFDADKKTVDLLIVMGSSLKVAPVGDVMHRIPHDVPQILINMESLPHMMNFDVQLLGDCDTIVSYLCRQLGWTLPVPEGGFRVPPAVMDSYTQQILPNKYVFGSAIVGLGRGKSMRVGEGQEVNGDLKEEDGKNDVEAEVHVS
ncbi:hypothetical protein SmJEL517_g05331 [Synchytrium microbalum]|uniref:Deacetylase sirtuin-type domain-containing protein n=1 Tax=Synchytrium microbalum TaxID=1806994 RepID=A0A507BW00_9FUNG|nr:uncharacterized protein SmJEL517_g05331 [Synchytrium microbalum]TPX31311.1 hypothetical protein SmJEL517_g05331 [Synchytrium microbalum]